jgi:hypothetical protein
MSNPVMNLLLRHKAQEVGEKQAQVNSAVTARLGNPPRVPVPDHFDRWCENRGLISCPASPETVALFTIQNPTMPPEAMAALLEGITAAHQHVGDPVSSWVVNRALETMFGEVSPPRSWKKEALRLWATLPYFSRSYITKREADRDAALRRSQNQLAEMKAQLKKEHENADENKTAA